MDLGPSEHMRTTSVLALRVDMTFHKLPTLTTTIPVLTPEHSPVINSDTSVVRGQHESSQHVLLIRGREFSGKLSNTPCY